MSLGGWAGFWSAGVCLPCIAELAYSVLVIVVNLSTKDISTHTTIVDIIFLILIPFLVSRRVLNGIDDIENVVLRHSNFKTGFDHIPKRFGYADSMPIPNIASRAQIGVALQQPCRKLFSQPHRKSLHDRCVRTGEFASFRSRASDTRCTFACVLASDDEEGFVEVVNFNWAASDATSVLESAPARCAMNASQNER
jgi:hypothetical protein